MAREVDEWIAKHDDQKVPPRVQQRVFDRHGGMCHITGKKIQPGDKWQVDHVHAMILGGAHRESNLAPALLEAHKKKTATEMKVKSKIARTRKKHLGIKTEGTGFRKDIKRKMNGDIVNVRTGRVINRGD